MLTNILQPLLKVENIPSFIYDSNQLLFRLHRLGSIPRECTLISADVSALYPSIPHTKGFRAITEFLRNRTKYSISQIISITRALELIITENYVSWNSYIYKQTSGVAMGTLVAVAYANIFMNWVDKELRQKAEFIYEYIRYIDDNLFIVPEDKIEELIRIANNILLPYIKFTYEKLESKSSMGLPFLDTQLSIAEEGRIQSTLYTKKTDRHAYLLPTSYHPPHITQNIPAAVFGRVRKICSREELFREDAEKAVQWLIDRGYKSREVRKK